MRCLPCRISNLLPSKLLFSANSLLSWSSERTNLSSKMMILHEFSLMKINSTMNIFYMRQHKLNCVVRFWWQTHIRPVFPWKGVLFSMYLPNKPGHGSVWMFDEDYSSHSGLVTDSCLYRTVLCICVSIDCFVHTRSFQRQYWQAYIVTIDWWHFFLSGKRSWSLKCIQRQ